MAETLTAADVDELKLKALELFKLNKGKDKNLGATLRRFIGACGALEARLMLIETRLELADD